jgi:hypothetical protein
MRLNPRRIAAVIAVGGSLLAAPASSQAIVNGSIDGTLHPNVGAVTVNTGSAQVLACTGTLISPTVLVTAAHCTAQLQQLGYSQADVSFDPSIGNGTDLTCGLTDCYVEPPKNSLYTGTLHTDPDFNGNLTGVDSHDIAVVRFNKPIKGIVPAALPSAGQLDSMAASGRLASQTFTNVGYGWHAIVNNNPQNWTGLLDGQRRYATSGFQSLTTSDLKLTENPAQGYGGVCSHDSGGPTLLQDGTLVALLSNIQSSRCASAFDEYRLDTDSARAFLANYVTLP